jgi:hypothetical protein
MKFAQYQMNILVSSQFAQKRSVVFVEDDMIFIMDEDIAKTFDKKDKRIRAGKLFTTKPKCPMAFLKRAYNNTDTMRHKHTIVKCMSPQNIIIGFQFDDKL